MTDRRLRVLVPLLVILLATSACGGDEDSGTDPVSTPTATSQSEAATVNDVYSTLNNGTPDYECDLVPAGARCWLFTDETETATNIFITGEEMNNPDSPVSTMYGGITADPTTVEAVATTLGVPNDDALWLDGVGFTYNAS